MKKLKTIRKLHLFGGFLLLFAQALYADTLTLEQSYELAKANFPILKQNMIQDKALDLKLQKWSANFLPSLKVQGSATYQSDVPQFSLDLPNGMNGVSLDLPKDRYQAYTEVDQLIYDGGAIKANKTLEQKQNAIDKQQVLVSEQQLKTQLIQTYFSLLLARQSKEIMLSTKDLLAKKQEAMEESVKAEVALEANVLRIKAEILKLNQNMQEVDRQIQTAQDILGILTGQTIDENTELEIPESAYPAQSATVNRPELNMLDLQKEKLNSSVKLVGTQNLPKVSAFAQGGFGYPNPYNFFDSGFSPFYIVGAHFTWTAWDWQQVKKQKEIVELRAEVLATEKENLSRNIQIQLQQQADKIDHLNASLQDDQNLVDIQRQLREISSSQLD